MNLELAERLEQLRAEALRPVPPKPAPPPETTEQALARIGRCQPVGPEQAARHRADLLADLIGNRPLTRIDVDVLLGLNPGEELTVDMVAVNRAIAGHRTRLTPHERRLAVALAAVMSLDQERLATGLGITPNAVKKAVERYRRQIRESLS